MVLAYVVSEYPARSHTFIRREIAALRGNGVEIYTFSIRRCNYSEILSESDATIYNETWSIFPVRIADLFFTHLKSLARSPVRYFNALKFGYFIKGGSFKGLVYAIFHFAEGVYLAEQLRNRKINAVHAHFANSGGKVAAIAAKYLNIPWMISLHGNADFGFSVSQWLPCLIKDARFVRCVSDFGAAQVMRISETRKSEKVFVSYSGLPESYKNLPKKKERGGGSKLKLLSVGRLSLEKGHFILLDAACKLKRKYRKLEFVLDIVGDGPERDKLIKQCNKLGITDNVIFHGAKEENKVFDYMKRADIFICSSLMEGLPQVLLEAMLVETPVIAPYLAGIPELIENRETGMLFPAGNIELLVQSIFELGQDKILYRKIAVAGRQRVLQNFLIEKTILPLKSKISVLSS